MSLSISTLITHYACPEYESYGDGSSLIIRDLSKRASESKFHTLPKGTTTTLVFGPVILTISLSVHKKMMVRMVHHGRMYRVNMIACKGGFIMTALRHELVRVTVVLIHRDGGFDATVDGRVYRLVKKEDLVSRADDRGYIVNPNDAMIL